MFSSISRLGRLGTRSQIDTKLAMMGAAIPQQVDGEDASLFPGKLRAWSWFCLWGSGVRFKMAMTWTVHVVCSTASTSSRIPAIWTF